MLYFKALGYFMKDFVKSLPRMLIVGVLGLIAASILIAGVYVAWILVLAGATWLFKMCAPTLFAYHPGIVEATVALTILGGLLLHTLFIDKWRKAVEKAREHKKNLWPDWKKYHADHERAQKAQEK